MQRSARPRCFQPAGQGRVLSADRGRPFRNGIPPFAEVFPRRVDAIKEKSASKGAPSTKSLHGNTRPTNPQPPACTAIKEQLVASVSAQARYDCSCPLHIRATVHPSVIARIGSGGRLSLPGFRRGTSGEREDDENPGEPSTQFHCAEVLSIRPGSLFLTLPTRALTGQQTISSAG